MALRKSAVVLIALLAVLSPLAGAVGFVGSADAAPPDFVTVPGENVERSSTTVDPERGPPTDRLPAQAGGPSAQPDVGSGGSGPPAHALDRIPDHALDNVLASRNADTMSVQFAPTSDGSVALVVTDDQNSAGREVGIPTDALESALGRQPEVARGVHESGERWTAPITYEDGHAIFEVPHFSTNTVTFSGTYTIDATAGDGSEFVYSIDDMDTVTNFSSSLTGVENTETETISASGIGRGHSQSLTLGGNQPLSGPAGGSPELELTGHEVEASTPADSYADNVYATGDDHWMAFRVDDPPSRITEASVVQVGNPTGGDWVTDICVVDGVDLTSGCGSASHTESFTVPESSMPSRTSFDFDSPYDVDSDSATIKMNVESASSDAFSFVIDASGEAEEPYSYVEREHGTVNKYGNVRLSSGPPSGVTVSADDGTSASPSISDGETVTQAFDVSRSASNIDLSLTSGVFDYTLTAQERTVTQDPSVEVNGNTVSHSGTLTDGSTEILSVNSDWLQTGENTVNVSAGGTLPSGSPEAKVGLDYEHGYTHDQTTTFNSRRWTSNYDISKTFGATQEQASLSVPFKDTAYEIQSAEMRINETGDWSTLADSHYDLVGNDLDVDLDAGYGGDIPAGTTIEVRANASKVGTTDLAMTVLNATDMGSTLDSKIQVESAGSNPSIEVGGTEIGDRVHYLYDETWGASETALVSPNSQSLQLPNAAAGETARVTHLPTAVSPESGEVELEVTETGAEPTLAVSPGPDGANTDVAFTHHATVSGATYLLDSVTNGIVRDSATANSPVTLVDDDSEETLEITKEDSGGTTDTGGGTDIADRVVGQFQTDQGGPNWPFIIATLAIGLGVLAVVQVRTGRSPITAAASGVTDAGSMLAARPRALAVLLVVGFGASIFLGIIEVPESVFVVLVVAAVAVLSFFGLQRTGRFSMPVYGLILAVSAFGALTATGQLSSIFDALGTPGSAILVMGLVALAWRALKSSDQPNKVQRFIFQGDSGGGGN